MTTATATNTNTKTKTKKAKSTIHWAEDWGEAEAKPNPTKYSINQLNNKLDFTGLEEKLEKILGIKVVITGQMQKTHSGRVEIDFVSDNLVEHVGILTPVMKNFVIHDWSNQLYEHENGDIILSTGVHFAWDFHKGGSNGHDLFWAFYNFDKREWAFNE